jgi:hypothetical protein
MRNFPQTVIRNLSLLPKQHVFILIMKNSTYLHTCVLYVQKEKEKILNSWKYGFYGKVITFTSTKYHKSECLFLIRRTFTLERAHLQK